ncbi:MAG: DUF1778 domain-containing protein [Rhizomicrobium sp.]
MPRSSSRAPRPRKEAVVNLRMPLAIRNLIDSAAGVLGKTRTAFIIESSRKHAADVLLDQRLFTLDGAQHGAFLKALDAPPPANAKLKRLMAGAAPWEK